MAKKSIFIGSARESSDMAKALAQHIDNTDTLKARRWWLGEFRLGDVVFDRLKELAGQVDGAVLIAEGVDETASRHKTMPAPRDNVILEYGMFASVLGRSRCVLVADEKVKIPSDLYGIVQEVRAENVDATAEKIVEHFRQEFTHGNWPKSKEPTIVVDPDIAEEALSRGKRHATWHQRSLYFGPEGAANWLAVSRTNGSARQSLFWVRATARQLAEKVPVRTYVSLGPGDGRIDSTVATMLASHDPLTRYIPVDISEGLLQRAMIDLGPTVFTPVGILTDFEEHFPFLARHLDQYGRRPFLFGLIGGTLGNLDHLEDVDLIDNLARYMQKDDHLLIDVSIKGPNWGFDADPRQNLHLSPELCRFFAYGVSQRYEDETISNLTRDFANRFEVRMHEHPHIAESTYLSFWFKEKEWLVGRICRYNWDNLIKLVVSRGFELVSAVTNSQNDGIVSDGLMLVRRT